METHLENVEQINQERKMIELNKEFWDKRYKENEIGWDIGIISTPIKEYIDQLKDKSIKILIPGCGNAHEAEYLFNIGFKNVFLIDISPLALENFKRRVPKFPVNQLICDDFFNHKEQYDLVIEQTFFCAINPMLREQYAKHVNNILKSKGKLVGLLFNDKLNDDKPPFGGNSEEYNSTFAPYFTIEIMEKAHNSITPRKDRELFIKMIKK
jgi:SAM-dependent methyltransferase